jgi:hypothetical protein
MIGLYSVVFCFFSTSLYKSPHISNSSTVNLFVVLVSFTHLFGDTNVYVDATDVVLNISADASLED